MNMKGVAFCEKLFIGQVIGVDLNYVFTSPLVKAPMASRH